MRIYLLLLVVCMQLFAVKVGEVSNVVGVRDNQLIGYGLVVGLNNNGDGNTQIFTMQTLANVLDNMNIKAEAANIKSKNIAAVMVTATIPAFARQGDKLSVYVSSVGDAKSLEGGTLLMTPLKGPDGNTYAIAQGPVSVGGFNSGGKGQKNHVTSASIRNGALVEREIPVAIFNAKNANLSLKSANFTNAVRVQNSINQAFKMQVAQAIDSRNITLAKPTYITMPEFLAKVQEIQVELERHNRVVIDEKTGTVIAGADIPISPIVITHGDITVKIRADKPDQAAPDGKTTMDVGDGLVVAPNNMIVTAPKNEMTISSLLRALQKLGAKPKDIISIIESMKTEGALQADLEII